MKKLLLVIALAAISAAVLFGSPADPTPISISQPDGSTITIIQYGDEFFHWATTTDGYKILRNEFGIFEYAVQDKNLFLIPSGTKASNPEERNPTEQFFLSKIRPHLPFAKEQIDEQLAAKNINRQKSAKGVFPTTGKRKLIMILANFNDTDTLYARNKFDDYMNKSGGVTGTGSFKDYYLETSYGQLEVTTMVTAWVTVPNTHNYYGPDSKWGQFAYDAIVQADSLGIDFSEFDNDGDGNVDGIAIIHQGRGQEASGSTNDIWSHSWNLQYAGYSSSQRMFDGVRVGAYTTQPERYGNGMSTIGVMCHEFGHNLGAPDYYDTNYEEGGSYAGTGRWDLMAGGSWNGTPGGTTPAHPNMFQKIAFDWVTPIVLTENEPKTLKHASSYPEAYIVETPNTNEYFVLENRQKEGFDSSIPGHGMLIYHVDEEYIYANSGSVNAYEHQGMYPKAANGNINSAGCPFPGTSNITEFTDYSNPNSITWNGELTNKPIMDIREQDSLISFTIIAKGIDEPIWGTHEATSQSILLNWQKNTSTDSVLLVWSKNNEFSEPIFGTIYQAGETLPGGEEVLYVGETQESLLHENLLPGIEYYYKLFSFHKGFYSKGLLLPASTLCIDFYELPFNQGFEDFGGSKPGTCWQVMKNTEMDGGISGQHLLPLDASDELLSWQINKQDTNNGEGTEFISSGKQSIRIPTEATDYNWLISPEIQLESGYADLIFTPWYMTNGYLGGKSTNFKVLVYAQSSWNLELEWERNPNNQMNKMVELNLDNYKGQLIQIAFVYVGNNTYPMALDEIAVLGGAGIRPYDITFKINYQGEPLANATVNFNETAITTDSTGMAIFVDQLPASNLAYTVLKEDFQSQTGLVSIVDKDITIELNLWLVGITTNVDNAIRVFPNPVSQSFTIQTNISEVMNYELYSLTGKLIKAGFVINNANIHTSNLANGLYYLSLKSATKSLTVKIIKQ